MSPSGQRRAAYGELQSVQTATTRLGFCALCISDLQPTGGFGVVPNWVGQLLARAVETGVNRRDPSRRISTRRGEGVERTDSIERSVGFPSHFGATVIAVWNLHSDPCRLNPNGCEPRSDARTVRRFSSPRSHQAAPSVHSVRAKTASAVTERSSGSSRRTSPPAVRPASAVPIGSCPQAEGSSCGGAVLRPAFTVVCRPAVRNRSLSGRPIAVSL